ncbi:DUF4917 family protein [Treponema sp. OMZ 788]|uniref:DUF4917 family protein n=1 Tax=Treponema sp. OMZ 788 TaxID=2563664 RepID=UPI0020A23488|nr:DUF4917 family protein [Treponema sp. OMZ 788]UTC64012.1 DUF4917 family protein [Treponema sp. OMZ 788]
MKDKINKNELITYEDLLIELETTKPNNHLLLGNGFNLSLGIKTSYKSIFEQMKINNSDYENIAIDNFDLEEFIGVCKSKIDKIDNINYQFMCQFFHNKIKLDFMKAVTQLVSREEKNIFQEKNEKIYLLLKQFDNFFTLNYDPFLYQLLMTYKREDIEDQQSIAFSNTFPFIKDLMKNKDKELFDIIQQAYDTGTLTIDIPNETSKSKELNHLTKAKFTQEINTLLESKYSKEQIKMCVDKLWKYKAAEKKKFIDKIDDGFGLFGNELLYQNPQAQNLYFLHGAFHIYKKGQSVYKITQQSEKALYQRIEEIVENAEENILCIFSDKNKEKEIQDEAYFINGLNKLECLEGVLVILGCALSDNDAHIFTQIQKSKIAKVYIASFKDAVDKNMKKAKKWFPEKEIIFFDIETITYNK